MTQARGFSRWLDPAFTWLWVLFPVLALLSITMGEAAAVILLISTLAMAWRGRASRAPRSAWLPLAAFAAWALVSMLFFAPSAGNAKDILAKWSFAFLAVLGLSSALKAEDLRRVVLFLACAAALLFPWYVWSFLSTEYGRARTFSGGAPNLGTNLMIASVFLIPLAASSRGRRAWALWALLAVLLAGLGLTLNRAALLGAAAGFIILSGRRWPAVLTALMAAAISVIVLFPESRAAQRVRSIVSYRTSFSSLERIRMWEAGMRMVRDRPLRGFASRRNFISEYSARYRAPDSIEAEPGHVHNSVLQTAILHGIPGLGLLAWFFAVLWAKSWRLFASAFRQPLGRPSRPLALALFPLLVAFLLNAQFDFVVADGQRAMMFYALFGLTLGAVSRARLGRR